jgi:hypothetical protein
VKIQILKIQILKSEKRNLRLAMKMRPVARMKLTMRALVEMKAEEMKAEMAMVMVAME